MVGSIGRRGARTAYPVAVAVFAGLAMGLTSTPVGPFAGPVGPPAGAPPTSASGLAPEFVPTPLPSHPGGLAFDPENEELFASLPALDRVVVLNTTSRTLVANLTVGTKPMGAIYDANDDRVFVVNNGSGNVSVINASTDRLVGTVPVGSNPTTVGFYGANDSVYVADYGSNNISVLNGSTLKATASIPVLPHPFGISPDGSEVTHPGRATITEIDQSSNTVGGTRPTGPDPYLIDCGIWTDPQANAIELPSSAYPYYTAVTVGTDPTGIACLGTSEVFVSNAGSDNVSVLQGTKLLATLQLSGPPGVSTSDPLTGGVFVGGSSQGTVTYLPAWVDTVVGAIPYRGGAVALASDPRAGDLLIADAGGPRLGVYNETTWSETESIVLPGPPVAVEFDPTLGIDLVVVNGSGRILEVSPSNGSAFATFATVPGATALAVDVAQGTVAVTDARSGSLYVLNGSTGRVARKVAVGIDPTGVASSGPLGEIAVSNRGSGNVSLLNASSLTLIASLATGTSPAAVAFGASNGALYVANSGSQDVSEFAANGSRATQTVGRDPVALAYLPTPALVYVANAGSNNVSVISGASGRLVATVAVPRPTTLAIGNTTGLLYVGGPSTGNLSVIPTARTFDLGATDPQVPSLARAFFAANGTAYVDVGLELDVFNLSAGQMVGQIGEASFTHTLRNGGATLIAPGPSNGTAYAQMIGTRGADRMVLLRGLTALAVSSTSMLAVSSLALDPARKLLYAAEQAGTVAVLNDTTLASVTSLASCGSQVVVDTAVGEVYCFGPQGRYASTVVTAYLASTRTVVQNIYLNATPTAGALDLSGNRLYLAMPGGIAVVDTSNNSVMRTLPLSSNAVLVGFDPSSGGLLLLESKVDRIEDINPLNGRVLAAETQPIHVTALQYLAGTGTLVGFAPSGNEVVTLDARSLTPRSIVHLGTLPVSLNDGLMLIPAASELFCVGCLGGGGSVEPGSYAASLTAGVTGFSFSALCPGPQVPQILVSLGALDEVSTVRMHQAGSCPHPYYPFRAYLPVGSDPGPILEAGSSPYFYVLNEGSANVSVIELNRSAFYRAGNLVAGADPVAAVYDAIDQRLFVANAGGNTVTIIDTLHRTVVRNVIVGTSPVGLAFDAAQDLVFVANHGSANVTEISGRAGTVVAQLGVSPEPDSVAIDSQLGLLLVDSQSSGTVTGYRWGAPVFQVYRGVGAAQLEVYPLGSAPAPSVFDVVFDATGVAETFEIGA